MTKTLTTALKQKDLPILIQRDGFVCLYCSDPLGRDYIFDHLDDNRFHNDIENLALAHQSCNIKKASNYDLKIIAQEKIKQNEEMPVKFIEDRTATENLPSEIEINKTLYNFTKKYIYERVNTDGSIPYADALNETVYLCQEKFGHGSEQTIRRYINQLTCGVAEFQIIKDDKDQKQIVKRKLNWKDTRQTYKQFLKCLLDIEDATNEEGKNWINKRGDSFEGDLQFIAVRFVRYYCPLLFTFKLKQAPTQTPVAIYRLLEEYSKLFGKSQTTKKEICDDKFATLHKHTYGK